MSAINLKCLMCGSTRMSEPKGYITMCLECETDWGTEALTKINWELHDKDARIKELEEQVARLQAWQNNTQAWERRCK